MPTDKFWGPDEVLMTNGNKTYTTGNYKELFQDIDYDVGYQMWLDNKNLTYDMIAPGVDVHCIHGVGVNTMETLEYKEDKFPDHNPKISFGDGDSTVNTRSLAGCLRWKENNGGKQLQYMNLTGVDHMSVMTDARILKYLLNLATINWSWGRKVSKSTENNSQMEKKWITEKEACKELSYKQGNKHW